MDTQLLGNLPRCKITHSCTPHEMPTAILHLYEYLYVYMIREKKNEAISVVHAEGGRREQFHSQFHAVTPFPHIQFWFAGPG